MSQAVTPELQAWISDQAAAGRPRLDLLESLLSAGWESAVARQALDDVLGKGLVAGLATDGGESLHALPESFAESAQPTPDLSQSPLYVDVGDRKVHVLMRMEHPRVVLFGNLLDDAECDALIEAARPRMARSKTVENETGGEEINEDRTSSGMFFSRGENDIAAQLEARIARLVNWPVENGEGLQVLRYGVGAEYKPHYDYFDPSQPGTARIVARGGQRVATLVIYLNEPEQGGGTTFPDVGLEVAPKRGHAVFFAYPSPSPSTRTLHGGSPVVRGEKWIATKWLRERVFE